MSVEYWFLESREAIREAFGDDADLFSRLLAGTSVITDMRSNKACRAYMQIKRDGEINRTCFFNTMFITVNKLLKNDQSCGRKVRSLYRNLCGDENVVTIDRWMLRYFGYDPMHHYLSDKLYDQLEEKIRRQAYEVGITPAQRQVEIWTRSRGSSESYGEIIRLKQIHRNTLLNPLL